MTLSAITQQLQTLQQDLTAWQHDLRLKEANETDFQRLADLETGLRQLQTTSKQIETDLVYQRYLLDRAFDAIIELDVDFKVKIWNKGAARIYGWTAEQAIGERLNNLTHTIYPYETLTEATEILKKHEHWQGEVKQSRQDGYYIDILSSVTLLRDKQGEIIGYLGINKDITSQKLAQKALHKTKEEFRLLVEKSPSVIFRAQMFGNFDIIYVTPNFVDILGYASYEIKQLSQFWLQYVHHDDKSALEQSIVALPHQESVEGEYRFQHKQGHYLWASVYMRYINNQDNLPEVIGYMVDITARKKAIDAEITSRQALSKSNENLQEFVYMASHDLQEPLRKVKSFGELLQKRYSSQWDEKAQQYLERMVSAAERGEKLTQQLLGYARITTHAQPFNPTPLNKILNEVTADLELQLEAAQARIEVDALPTVMADAIQMHQLFFNLLTNSLKYHRQGVPPIIQIKADLETTCHKITVQDNGIGFDPKYAEEIFIPFKRLHSQQEYKGTGIGLAICRKIVERHQGRITAHGVIDIGTTFIIYLPILS